MHHGMKPPSGSADESHATPGSAIPPQDSSDSSPSEATEPAPAARKPQRSSKRGRNKGSAYHDLASFFGVGEIDPTILDELMAINMRSGRTLSATMLVLYGAVIFFDLYSFASGHLVSCLTARICCAVAGIASCLQLFFVASRYLNATGLNRPDRRPAAISLAVFILVAFIGSIVISLLSYLDGGTILPFIIATVTISCLIAIPPVIAIPFLAISFGVMIAGMRLMHPLSTQLLVCMVCILSAQLIASSACYTSTRKSASMMALANDRLHRDPLTNRKNRLSLEEELGSFVGIPLILMMTDVDDFKFFNDAYGHKVGDQVLRDYANVLVDVFGRGNVYRYGGDEFLVILRNTSEDEFKKRFVEFRDRIHDIRIAGKETQLTASVGYCMGTASTASEINEMQLIADQRLYVAKALGKDRPEGIRFEDACQQPGSQRLSRAIAYKSKEADQLTGLANMQYFRSSANTFLSQKADDATDTTRYAIVYFNLANFKAFNERYGFNEGDRLLRKTGEVLNETFPGCLISRLAEDHFILLCTRKGVEKRVEKAHAEIEKQRRDVPLELKAGIYEIADARDNVISASDRAKAACESITDSPASFCRFFDEELNRHFTLRRYIIDNLDDALENEHIKVFYQPIFRASTRSLCGSEALVRWVDETYGTMPPDLFVEVLEKKHLIDKLDSYVIHRVCNQWRETMQANVRPLPVSVNLSRMDFMLTDVNQLIVSEVDKIGLPRQMLRIEVTESAMADAAVDLRNEVEKLRKSGFQVWMDDFGAGYSSLNELRNHDYDVVKIDMAFLKKFDDERTRRVLNSIVSMIRSLGMHSLVEGVETREQFEFMRSIGCELIQGYYLGEPMPYSDFLAYATSGSVPVEDYAEHGYYNAIGRMNLQSPAPLQFDENLEAKDANETIGIATAIVERCGGTIHILMSNAAFCNAISAMGFSGVDEYSAKLNDREDQRHADFNSFLDNVFSTDRIVNLLFTENGNKNLIRGRRIASYGEKHAAIITIENAAWSNNAIERDIHREALNNVHLLYERVDLINLSAGNTIDNVFQNYGQNAPSVSSSSPLSLPVEQPSIIVDSKKWAQDFASEFIHPADRDRYLAFCDLSTIWERIEHSGKGYLSGIFRVKLPDGTYKWQILLEIPMRFEDDKCVVSCLRDADPDAMRWALQPDSAIPESVLWNSILNLTKERVFWKDANRRFLGANKNFLDYYGFSSVNEIFGKTDEEIGWHINPEPFKQDEIRLLTTGTSIVDAIGQCISHGKNHTIVANKEPLFIGSSIVGLIGTFSDAQDSPLLGPSSTDAETSMIDEATGMLNMRGFTSEANDFILKTSGTGKGFALILVHLDNLDELIAVHGNLFGDHALRAIARIIDSLCGTTSVSARLGLNEFGVLIATDDPGRVPEHMDQTVLANEIKRSFDNTVWIDSIPCKLLVSTVTASSSEASDLPALYATAISRF